MPEGAEPYVPDRASLASLRAAVDDCRGCQLWEGATQGVIGEGLIRAKVMFVGEQPGDREDLEGRPFVGPAGRELDRGLDEAEIPREDVYITNAVKHFKFQQRGKRRIHKRPSTEEIQACRPWLEAEVTVIRPEIIVALGATAAQGLLGRDFRVTRQRGEIHDSELGPLVTATVHPSSILRQQDDASRQAERAAFVEDLKKVARFL